MQTKSMFKKSALYFQKIQKNIKNKLDTDKTYSYKFYENNDKKHIIEIYDNDKFVLKAEYEYIGVFNIMTSVWYWSWNINMINKDLTKSSLEVKKLGEKIMDNYTDYNPREADELYYISQNGNFFTSIDVVKKIVQLSLYLTKSDYYIPINYEIDGKSLVGDEINKLDKFKKIDFILLKKIISFS